MQAMNREQLLAKLEAAAALDDGCSLAPSEVRLLLHRPAATEPATEPLPVQLRWLIRRDLSDIVQIDAASYGEPWDEERFLVALRKRNCIGYVAESAGVIVGYMIYDLHKDHLRVLRFAVDQDQRRRSVGREMVTRLIDKLHQQRRRHIDIAVPEDNLDAHLFLRAMGFRATGMSDDGEIQFRYTLPVDVEAWR